jgi:hypothetical protein
MTGHVSKLVERARIRREMERAIAIPVRRDRIARTKREPLDVSKGDDAASLYALQRRAELMGEGTYCLIETGEVGITGPNSGVLTGTALGLLRTRDEIEAVEFRAGCLYGGLRSMLYPRAVPGSTSVYRMMALELGEVLDERLRARETPDEHAERIEEARIMYYRGDNRLRQLPHARRVREMLRVVVIDDRMPDESAPIQVKWLREGLRALVDTWDLDAKRQRR